MRSVKLTYKTDEMEAVRNIIAAASLQMGKDVDNTIKLKGVILYKLALKLTKSLLIHRTKYTVNYTTDEALAFYIAYDKGNIATTDIWMTLILNGTFEAIHNTLNLHNPAYSLNG